MTSALDIQIELLNGAQAGDPCRVRIASGETVFTNLIREQGRAHDDAVLAAPEPLAFWLCDNWWRLRWETIPPNGLSSASWRLAHDIAAVGGGYSWPRLCLWGDLDRIGLLSQADPVGVVGPVRYLTDALVYIHAAHFEREVDDFLDHVVDEQRRPVLDGQALRALIEALRQERADPETARWRRLEARLGFNPDQAPDGLIQALNALADTHGLEAVEEAIAAAPSDSAADELERVLTGNPSNRAQLQLFRTDVPLTDRRAQAHRAALGGCRASRATNPRSRRHGTRPDQKQAPRRGCWVLAQRASEQPPMAQAIDSRTDSV